MTIQIIYELHELLQTFNTDVFGEKEGEWVVQKAFRLTFEQHRR